MDDVRLPGDLRHYLPLFFLAPSMAMMIYAWNRQSPPPPRILVDVVAEGFSFPADVQLYVVPGDDDPVAVRGSIARLPYREEGPVTLRLQVRRGADRSEWIGAAQAFVYPAKPDGERWALSVSAAECRAALSRLRSPR